MTGITRRELAAAAAALPLAAAPARGVGTAAGVTAPLDITENAFGPSRQAKAALSAGIARANNYAHDEEVALARRIAEANGVAPDHVVLSTGSLEMLSLATVAWTRDGVQLLPALTYDTHAKYAARQGGKARRAPMAADLGIDFAAMDAAMGPDVRLAYVCNPNNPTGLLADRAALRAWCIETAKRVPVIVDEAFIDMLPDPAAESTVDLVRAGHDVIVAGTFSKSYGLAALRIGYAIARPERAAAIRAVLATSHNLPGLLAAAACYRDPAYLAASNRAMMQGRAVIEAALAKADLPYLKSAASYVFADFGTDAAGRLARFEAAGVRLRQFGADYPRWARIAVREPQHLAAFAERLPRIL